MLNEIKIGGLSFSPPIALAPMAGYSDYPMRCIVRELGGCGLFYTELISCHSVIHAHAFPSSPGLTILTAVS